MFGWFLICHFLIFENVSATCLQHFDVCSLKLGFFFELGMTVFVLYIDSLGRLGNIGIIVN